CRDIVHRRLSSSSDTWAPNDLYNPYRDTVPVKIDGFGLLMNAQAHRTSWGVPTTEVGPSSATLGRRPDITGIPGFSPAGESCRTLYEGTLVRCEAHRIPAGASRQACPAATVTGRRCSRRLAHHVRTLSRAHHTARPSTNMVTTEITVTITAPPPVIAWTVVPTVNKYVVQFVEPTALAIMNWDIEKRVAPAVNVIATRQPGIMRA